MASVEQIVTYSIYGHIAAIGEMVAQTYGTPRNERMVGVRPPRELTQLLSLGIEGPSAADMKVWSSTRTALALQMGSAVELRDLVIPILSSEDIEPGSTLMLPEDYEPAHLSDALTQALNHTSERVLDPIVEVERHLAQLREVLIPRIADLTDVTGCGF